MKCSVCGCGLANDLKGREAHMKKYHAVTLEAPKPKTYVPMDPKEKAEKIKRMEARLASKIVLDDKGELKAYGEPLKAEHILEDWPTTDFGFEPRMVILPEPVQGVNEPKVAPKVENGWPVLEKGPILTQEDVNRRLDNLVDFSGAVLTKMKEVFGE